MLDPKFLREALDSTADQLKKRGFVLDTETFTRLETQRKNLQTELQNLQSERNLVAKTIGIEKSKGQDVSGLLAKGAELGEQLKVQEQAFADIQNALLDFQLNLPNIPHFSVPVGQGEAQNKLVRTFKKPTAFDFTPRNHLQLGELHGLDFAGAAKLSGARFVVLQGDLARLHRALGQFMLDLHAREHGYQELYVPYLVQDHCLVGTGQLPKFREDHFKIAGWDLNLIPTAEVPITNLFKNVILEEKDLPVKHVSLTPCFRSEAGSYGKDTQGFIRQHQFDKVEMVQIAHPDSSYKVLEEITQHAETVLKKLHLPYQVVELCTGDLGFGAAKTYDLEVWLPGQNRYREVSSCSNYESFQARRMQARFRRENGKIDLMHTLNGSGLAVGRTLIAIIENFQDEQGRIHIPEVLWPYMAGVHVL